MKYQLIIRREATHERPGVYVVRAIDGKNELPPSPPYGYLAHALLSLVGVPPRPFKDMSEESQTLAKIKARGDDFEILDETAKYA